MTQDLQDTIPDGLHPARSLHALPIRFTGSGSEYFRIWIVNLLLTVVTLGIYLPWAKVRRLKYFHGNTLVGDAPLGFHGNPRKMLRGYLLVGILFVLYSLAGSVSPVAGLVALAAVVAIGPALLRASLQFRLANTSWRGLRLRFTGELPQVYRLLLPVAGLLVLGFLLGWLDIARTRNGREAGLQSLLLLLATLATALGGGAWMLWRLKQYQHGHYALGRLQTRFAAGYRPFLGLFLRLLGLALLLLAVVMGPLLVFAAPRAGQAVPAAQALLLALLPLLLVLVVLVVLKPYAIARLQNLVWSHTSARGLGFHSQLAFGALLRLTLKNWCLILLTLGLYWPFAAIASARLRLQAVSLALREDPDALVAEMRSEQVEAVGDAAGDLFGLDIGL